jgi:hypothetical protein
MDRVKTRILPVYAPKSNGIYATTWPWNYHIAGEKQCEIAHNSVLMNTIEHVLITMRFYLSLSNLLNFSKYSDFRSVFCRLNLMVILGILGMSNDAYAASVIDAHIGRVKVANQSSSAQTRATQAAIKQVLVKMTGQTDLTEFSSLSSVIKNANNYLRSYRYDQRKEQLYFIAEFDRTALENKLITSELPIWGRRRPDTIVWLATENEISGQREILAESAHSDLVTAVTETALNRGVPLSLPIMDLDDAQAVTIFDVWGLFSSRLTQASARYNSDFVIGARLYLNKTTGISFRDSSSGATVDDQGQDFAANIATSHTSQTNTSGLEPASAETRGQRPFSQDEFEDMAAKAEKGKYTLDYTYTTANGPVMGSLFGDKPTVLVADLVNLYGDAMAQSFAIVPSENNSAKAHLELSVGNLDNLQSYVLVQRYLSSLSVTQNVVLIKQHGSVATFAIDLLGEQQDLLNILSLDKKLEPLRDTFGQPLEGLNFFWNK